MHALILVPLDESKLSKGYAWLFEASVTQDFRISG